MIPEGSPANPSDVTILSLVSSGTPRGDLELHFPSGSFAPVNIEDLLGKMPDNARYRAVIEPATAFSVAEVLTDPNTWEFLGALGAAIGTSATYDTLKHLVHQAFEHHQEQEDDELLTDEELAQLARRRVVIRYNVPAGELHVVSTSGREDGSKVIVLNDGLWQYSLTYRKSKAGPELISYQKALIE